MKLKKKRKSVRMRGSRTHGWAMKKHKGKGNVGGKGMAGSGKRAAQKKTRILNMEGYFGKKGMKAKKKILNVINVGDIEKNISGMISNGQAKKTGDAIEVYLKDYKILGDGDITLKFIIHARTASPSAKEKIEKRGGKIIEE